MSESSTLNDLGDLVTIETSISWTEQKPVYIDKITPSHTVIICHGMGKICANLQQLCFSTASYCI